ncbi:MAG: flagellar brake protein [Syntrophaceae bacterium]|nr:flagellar brake protein [Syntrophaceae bacterium]
MALLTDPAASGSKDKLVNLPGLTRGTLIQLQFEGLGSSRSLLLGMDPGKFIIVQTSPISDIGSKVFEKNNCIVRYLSAGRVYAFRCTLLGLIKEPCRFSILSYPESFEVINLRKYERVSCIIDAGIRINENFYEGIITDISMGGCSFDFSKSDITEFPNVNILDKVSVSMNLKDKEFMENIGAIVRSIRKDENNLSLGLQFNAGEEIEQNGKTKGALADYLRNLVEGL